MRRGTLLSSTRLRAKEKPAGGSVAAREAVRKGSSTKDYLNAIGETRTTVSHEVHEQFLEDIDALGRV